MVGSRAETNKPFPVEGRDFLLPDSLVRVLEPEHIRLVASEKTEHLPPLRLHVLPLVYDKGVEAPAFRDSLCYHPLLESAPEVRIGLHGLEVDDVIPGLQKRVNSPLTKSRSPDSV